MTKNKLWYLQRINLFKDLPTVELKSFTHEVEMKEFKKGDVIFLPGQLGQFIYMVKEGFVKLSQLSPEGKEFTLTILGTGQIFGELEAFNNQELNTLAKAHTDCILCIHSKESLVKVIADNPDLFLTLTKSISSKNLKLQNQLANLVFKSAPKRLICLLHELAISHGSDVSNGTKINIPLTHQDIADLLGTARQTISETLAKLREEGHITIDKKNIILTSIETFESIWPEN